ncbi:hypothetical protein QB910_000060 [Dabrowskivirus KKP3916]|uniref:Uncharacterized protein n=1 Tax=Alicyclobacillus phage KKP_3916 TaxID=3040651 RepID=A0AAT9V7J6_9CAUD|nr:hypothetical protein QB910_000060 [Alicyclobacillus phage KKP 3916]
MGANRLTVKRKTAKIYHFPNLKLVYEWLDEARKVSGEIEEFYANPDSDITSGSQKAKEERLDVLLKLIANEIIPDEDKHLDELMDFLDEEICDGSTNESIVKHVISAKNEILRLTK